MIKTACNALFDLLTAGDAADQDESKAGAPAHSRAAENLQQLRIKYPEQFRNPRCNLSWPDGWHELVDQACRNVAIECEWKQIKEKFGSLRMYSAVREASVNTMSSQAPQCWEFAHAVAEAAEALSYRTCGKCGHGALAHVEGTQIPLCEPCLELMPRSA